MVKLEKAFLQQCVLDFEVAPLEVKALVVGTVAEMIYHVVGEDHVDVDEHGFVVVALEFGMMEALTLMK